jgi:hypothetical protein
VLAGAKVRAVGNRMGIENMAPEDFTRPSDFFGNNQIVLEAL